MFYQIGSLDTLLATKTRKLCKREGNGYAKKKKYIYKNIKKKKKKKGFF